MITIPCLCRNDSRVPPLWWGYSSPDWGHVHCKVPQLGVWEKQHTPSSNHQNKEPKNKLGEQGTYRSTTDLRQHASLVALRSSHCMCRSCSQAPRGWNCAALHSLCEGGYLFVAQCLGLQPSATNALADSSAEKLLSFQPAATGQGFPLGKYLNKVYPGRYPRSMPSCPAKQQDIPEQGSLYVYLYVCICLDTHTNISRTTS